MRNFFSAVKDLVLLGVFFTISVALLVAVIPVRIERVTIVEKSWWRKQTVIDHSHNDMPSRFIQAQGNHEVEPYWPEEEEGTLREGEKVFSPHSENAKDYWLWWGESNQERKLISEKTYREFGVGDEVTVKYNLLGTVLGITR